MVRMVAAALVVLVPLWVGGPRREIVVQGGRPGHTTVCTSGVWGGRELNGLCCFMCGGELMAVAGFALENV